VVEVLVQRRQRRQVLQEADQVRAHGDQLGGAAGGAVEPADQLLAARLGGLMQRHGGGLGRLPAVGFDGGLDARAVGAEVLGERGEEVALGVTVEPLVGLQRLVGESDAGGLALLRQQGPGQRQRVAAVRLERVAAGHQPPAPVDDAREQALEEAGHSAGPIRAVGSQVTMPGNRQRITIPSTIISM